MLHTNLASLSSAKALPYLVMFLTSNLGGWAGDYLIAKRVTSTAGGRKAVNTIGTLLRSLLLVLLVHFLFLLLASPWFLSAGD